MSGALQPLAQLWSFSHHACDVELLRRNSDLVAELKLAHYPADGSLYGGTVFLLVWATFGLGTAWQWYRSGRRWAACSLAVLFAAVALLGLYHQIFLMSRYARECLSVLGIK